ncbi:hypothetical protein CSA08_02460 [Candidatus Gracilibacteria bacterium]|nr:MAG: hypothetical protein CSA08_02460 [Candidatus Gracilibacteria bacterium]
MIVSIINILLIIFAGNITDINVLGILKINNLNSISILILLLITNIYVLTRYKQYLFKNDLNLNQKILIFDIINNKFFQKNIIEARQMEADRRDGEDFIYTTKKTYKRKRIESIKFNGVILLNYNFKDGNRYSEGTYLFCHGGITDKNINGGFYGNIDNNNLFVYLHNNNKDRLDDNIHIEYKNNNLILFFLKLKFYIKDHYFFDYYLPILLGILSMELIIIKMTYLIFK